MTPQNSSAKPSMLSEEYVANSSDEDNQEAVVQKRNSSKKYRRSPSIKSATANESANRHGRKKSAAVEEASDSGEAREEDDVVLEDGEDEDEAEEENPKRVSGNSTGGRHDPAGSTKKCQILDDRVPEHQRKTTKPIPKEPVAIPAKPFQPPNGYQSVTFSSDDYATDFTDFLSANLSRKQVWYITAPASIDMKSVQPFSIVEAHKGKPIFRQHGVDYGFSNDLHHQEILLLAENVDIEYKQGRAAISRKFHLREIIKSKKPDSSSKSQKVHPNSHFTAQIVPPSNPTRQQPEGLRMRYQPFGSVKAHGKASSSLNSSTFSVPPEASEKRVESAEKKKKKKRQMDVEDQPVETTPDADLMDIDQGTSAVTESMKTSQGVSNGNSDNKEKKKRKRKHMLVDETGA